MSNQLPKKLEWGIILVLVVFAITMMYNQRNDRKLAMVQYEPPGTIIQLK